MGYKKYAALFVLGFRGLMFLSAQIHMEMEDMLENPAITYAQAARFVLEASETVRTPDPEEAFYFAINQKWLPRNVYPDEEARLDRISLLVMRSFNIKGGILYSITHSPHFAYRELVYQNIIQGRVDPHITVSGSQLLFIISRLLSSMEFSFRPEL